MCGIAGFLDPGNNRRPESMRRYVIDMTNSLAHRGPDDEGAWVDPNAGIALGNRRLAIIDLSPEGHQPMHSTSGRYVITYNGEVYNSAAIARALEFGRFGATLARSLGHRGDSCGHRSLGPRQGARVVQRHVRVCALGCARANTVPRARSNSA